MSTRLFFLLVVLLPTQLTLYWFIPASYVYGLPIDYLAAQVSFTDGIIALLLLSQLRPLTHWLLQHTKGFAAIVFSLFYLVLTSPHWDLSALYALKILELSFVAWYILMHKKRITPWIGKALLLPLFVSAVIAVWQFTTGKSIGGLLYYLGERTFSYSTPGIAHIALWGNHLRPYATFPHPNVLAAFAAFVILVNFQYSSRRLFVVSIIVGLPILILTFSKAAVLGLVAALVVSIKPVSAKALMVVLITVSLLSPIAASRILSYRSFPSSIQERLILMVYSGQMISMHPLTGVGMNGFIPALPDAKAHTPWVYPLSWWLQPVHNVYLLVATQGGMLATAGLAGVFLTKRKVAPLFVFLAVAGLFDHYFLTLQQGQIMTAIILALSFF